MPNLPFVTTAVPSSTPTPTLPPTLTPSPTPLPSATPTLTPIPPARVENADAALFAGDWSLAQAEYQAVLDQSTDPALREAAQLGLAQAWLLSGQPQSAITILTDFLSANPESAHAAEAQFLLGDAYRAAQEWQLAMDAYRAFLALRPGAIDSYAQANLAQAAVALGDYPSAAEALEAAIAAPRQGDSFNFQEQLAEVKNAQGDLDGAVAVYDAVIAATVQNWRKAQDTVKAGQLLYAAGRAEEAYPRFLDAVNNYPETTAAFDALLVLVNDGIPVDDLQRGLTNYYADNYDPALEAFQRYRAAFAAGAETTSAPGDAQALYFIGLTEAGAGRDAQAIAAWRDLVATYPADPHWTKAYFQIAFLQPYPDDVETFVAFAAAAPAAAEAPDALFRAARLHERNDQMADAVTLWTRIALEYPDSAEAADASMQAGLVFYREGDESSAALRFEMASGLGTDPDQHARAWLWIGKVRARRGDEAGANEAYARAASFGPHGYYPLRAAQLLLDEPPFTPPASYSFEFDAAAEQAAVEAWLRANFPQAQSVDHPSELQPGVFQEGRFVRGRLLWQLGHWEEAHAEFDSLRLDLAGDPLSSWQLALYFNQIGAYDLSIRAARHVVDAAGISDTLVAPTHILRLRYPAPFANLVVPAASQYGMHPFIMYSKMRIESFFWKFAYSVADARGLNQFIPPTADDVAAQLGLTNFTYEDLFRPAVSIPMGAYYLNFIAEQTAGGPGSILAGYYAGPGNAQIWLDMAQADPDLFLEVIRLPDAKGYVQTTFEYFEEYKVLYGK
jgi:soluble lytic murein transglycosylase